MRGFSGSLLLILAFGSTAYAERPTFQAPYSCGQVWRASTYEGHGSNAIDIVERDADLNIIGEFQPIIASAAGKIAFDHTWPAGSKLGERWVIVDHGDNWRTHYFHIEAEEGQPRLKVGRKVAMGEVLGRTSNSGANDIHLHYAQMKGTTRNADSLNNLARANVANFSTVLNDGAKVRIRFNEQQIDTYLANEDSWLTFSNNQSEKIRSLNCLAGRFVHWYSQSDSYILRYSPGSYDMRVNRIDPTGDENPQTLSENWGADWNTIVPFYSGTNRQPHLIRYNFATGETDFHRVSPDNEGLTFLKSRNIYAGWTEIVPLMMGGKPHAIFYDSRYGWFNVDEINVTSDGFISRLKTRIGTGFTHLVSFKQGPRRYVLTYSAATGKMALQKLTKASDGKFSREQVWKSKRAAGWTHMIPLTHRGQGHVLSYNSASGIARLWHIRPNGEGLERGAKIEFGKGWSALTPYSDDGRAHVLLYRAEDGRSRKIRLRDSLEDFRIFTTETWTAGYR